MQKTMKKWLPIIIIAVLVIAIVGFVWWQKGAGNKTLKIGYISPMSGNAAAYGDYTRKAFQLALDEWNANHKTKLEVVYEDGKCSPTDAVAAANKLINIDKVNYLMTYCTGETNAVAPIAEKNKILLLTAGTTAPNIFKGQYIFRNIGSVGSGLGDLTRLAYQADKQMALISENTDYAKSTKQGFKDEYSALGGTVLYDESFDSKSADFRTIITKLKSDKVATIFVVVQSMDGSGILFKQMKEMNYHPRIFSTEGAISTKALEKYQTEGYEDMVEGTILVQPYFDRENPKAKHLLSMYESKYKTTQGPVPESFLATQYDAVYLLGQAIENSGSGSDAIRNYFISQIHNWDGAVGSFGFDTTGDAVVKTQVNVVKDGQIVKYQ